MQKKDKNEEAESVLGVASIRFDLLITRDRDGITYLRFSLADQDGNRDFPFKDTPEMGTLRAAREFERHVSEIVPEALAVIFEALCWRPSHLELEQESEVVIDKRKDVLKKAIKFFKRRFEEILLPWTRVPVLIDEKIVKTGYVTEVRRSYRATSKGALPKDHVTRKKEQSAFEDRVLKAMTQLRRDRTKATRYSVALEMDIADDDLKNRCTHYGYSFTALKKKLMEKMGKK